MMRLLIRSLAVVAALGAFLSFTNPFGATGTLPWWAGFLYWTLLVGEGWFGGTMIAGGIERLFPRINLIANRIVATALVAAVVAATIVLIQLAINQAVPLSYWPTLYGLVLGHALFQRDDRVVRDRDALGADLGAALGDVAVADALGFF